MPTTINTPPQNGFRPLIGFAALLLIFFIHQSVELPNDGWLMASINNSLHIPMFAIATGVLAWARPRWSIWIVTGIMCALAVASEALQVLGARTASVSDLALNAIGIALGVLFTRLHRRAWAIGGLIVATLAYPAYAGVHLLMRSKAFPTLYDPQNQVLHTFAASASDSRRVREQRWQRYPDSHILSVTWNSEAYPNVRFSEPVDDWSEYQFFVAHLFNPTNTTQRIVLGVSHHRGTGPTAKSRHEAPPGEYLMRVAVSELMIHEAGEPLPILAWQLFTHHTSAGLELWIGQVYLSR